MTSIIHNDLLSKYKELEILIYGTLKEKSESDRNLSIAKLHIKELQTKLVHDTAFTDRFYMDFIEDLTSKLEEAKAVIKDLEQRVNSNKL